MPRAVPTNFYIVLLLILLAANVSFYQTIFAPRALEVTVLEVGKGNVTLVRAPNGATILINTGPDASILRALGAALPPWQRRIDAVILTSNKKTSTGGLPDVLARYKIGQQITITKSRRLILDNNTYIDITLTKNAPAGVYVSDGGTVTEIR